MRREDFDEMVGLAPLPADRAEKMEVLRETRLVFNSSCSLPETFEHSFSTSCSCLTKTSDGLCWRALCALGDGDLWERPLLGDCLWSPHVHSKS